MASFLAGPAAQLVGAGMQAIGVGIPVGQTCSKVIDGMRGCGLPVPPKTWFKTKRQQSEERTPQRNVYDKLESHLNGMIQVVKPALELKNIVQNGCKSADRVTCRRGSHQSPKEKAIFYTPQNCSSGRCKLFDDRTPNLVRIPPEKKVAKRSCKYSGGDCKKKNRKPRDDSSDEDESCMYCSRSRSLIELPCGHLICSKCDKTGDHDLECKQCKNLNS